MKTSNSVTNRTRIVAAALTAAGALLSSALPASAAWQHAHGDSANTGFARVAFSAPSRAIDDVVSIPIGIISQTSSDKSHR